MQLPAVVLTSIHAPPLLWYRATTPPLEQQGYHLSHPSPPAPDSTRPSMLGMSLWGMPLPLSFTTTR